MRKRCGCIASALVKAGFIIGLFTDFVRHMKHYGYLALGVQIIDATIVPVPKNRNSREKNEAIRSGEMPKKVGKAIRPNGDRRIATRAGPEAWPVVLTATRTTAASTGGTNSVRRYTVTNAARHDSQEFDAVLDEANTRRTCGPTARTRSAETEKNWRVGISGSCSPTGEAKPWPFPNANRKAMRLFEDPRPGGTCVRSSGHRDGR